MVLMTGYSAFIELGQSLVHYLVRNTVAISMDVGNQPADGNKYGGNAFIVLFSATPMHVHLHMHLWNARCTVFCRVDRGHMKKKRSLIIVCFGK